MNKELLIQKYFKGDLSPEEQQSFDQLLESDDTFSTEVAEYEDIQQAIKESERQALKAKLSQLETEINQDSSSTKVRRLWPLAIAAAIAVLLAIAGILYWPSSNSAEELYAANFEAYPNALLPIKRGQETTSLDIQAFLAYEEGNYDSAIEKFGRILENEEEADIRFYYAMSLQNIGKFDLALKELQQIDGKTTKFQAQIEWYSTLIYIKKEDWQNAKDALGRLTQLNTAFKKAETQVLLEKLSKE